MWSFLKNPVIVYPAALLYLLFALLSCSSTPSTTHLDKYDAYDFADRAVFNRTYDDTFNAVHLSLERMGFTVIVSDRSTGLLTAEQERDSVLPEEVKAGHSDESASFWTVFLIVLSIILIVGIVILLAKGCEEDSETEKERDDAGGGDIHIDFGSDEKTYRYVVTANVRESEEAQTEVVVGVVRVTYGESSRLKSSEQLENKYINHLIFDIVEDELATMDSDIEQ